MGAGYSTTKTPDDMFWNWFAKNASHYYYVDKDQGSLYLELKKELRKVDSNLTFEFSPIDENGVKKFVITANGITDAFPAVIGLVRKAPKITGWDIIAFKQRAKGYKEVRQNGLTLSYGDVYFRFAKDYGKIGLEIHIRKYDEDNDDFNSLVFLMLDQLLGEYDTETKLSRVEVIELEEGDLENLFPIVELPDIVDGYIREFHN